MAKVKVFVHATDADADGRAMTLAPRTYLSLLAKNCFKNRIKEDASFIRTNISNVISWFPFKVILMLYYAIDKDLKNMYMTW